MKFVVGGRASACVVKTVLVAALCLASCMSGRADQAVQADDSLPSYRSTESVTGSVTSIGAHNLDTLMQSWGEAFQRIYPEAKIDLHPGVPLSAEGLDALIEGRAELAPFAREAFPSEEQAFQARFGYAPLLICVAGGSYATKFNTHALAIYVNASNPLKQLTIAQLDAIYSRTRRLGYPEDITRWGQLGLTGDWANRPIHLYGMVSRYKKTGNPPGILYFFTQRALGGGEMKSTVREIADPTRPELMRGPGDRSEPRPITASGGSAALEALDGIVAAVATDPAGIGYSGFRNKREGTKTLALGENPLGPFSAGTLQDVLRRDYPLSRKVYIAVNQEPGKPMRPILREFLRFVLSREGQAIVAHDPSEYLPLTTSLANEARAQLR
ncbi:MAG: pstS [Candidatus Eremiobacteraeota bacterium]|nr:pstS [Candidatus Eremiobacteraeota bacterium]